jgi:hypothetical protein
LAFENAYTKTTFIHYGKTSTTNAKLDTRLTSHHMGTPSFHGKCSEKESIKVSKLNLVQAASIFAQNIKQGIQKVIFNILNSPVNPTGIDSSIASQTKKSNRTDNRR